MNQGSGSAFPQTRASVVRDLGSVDPVRRAAAFDALVRSYWRPVYVYIRLRWHRSAEDAQDLAQDFFTRAFEREYLSGTIRRRRGSEPLCARVSRASWRTRTRRRDA